MFNLYDKRGEKTISIQNLLKLLMLFLPPPASSPLTDHSIHRLSSRPALLLPSLQDEDFAGSD